MPKIFPDSVELDLLCDLFIDAAMMYGFSSKLVLFDTYSDNGFGDITPGNTVEYDVDIFFDEFPDVRTLKSLNWFIEDDEILPSLVYVCRKVIDNNQDSLIDIRDSSYIKFEDESGSVKELSVSAVKSRMRGKVFYICKVVPKFDKIIKIQKDPNISNVEKSKLDSNFNYFKVNK